MLSFHNRDMCQKICSDVGVVSNNRKSLKSMFLVCQSGKIEIGECSVKQYDAISILESPI